MNETSKIEDRVVTAIWVLLVMTLLGTMLTGCMGAYQSQTTVIGVEVQYDPTQSVIPSARAGVITHRQQAMAKDAARQLENSINYYGVELWKGAGNVSGTMTLQPGEGGDENGEVQK